MATVDQKLDKLDPVLTVRVESLGMKEPNPAMPIDNESRLARLKALLGGNWADKYDAVLIAWSTMDNCWIRWDERP
jgi:hypothetical protein